MKQSSREWIAAIITAVMIAVIVIQFIVPTTVYGKSMEPAFEEKDYLLVSKQAYSNEREPKRGDVIVFKSHLKTHEGENKNLIKRVIALPGETVEVRDGKVYINGEEFKEDYTKDGITNGTVDPVIVPDGNVFCLGDNRLYSTDSRFLEVGFIKEEDIIGKVFFRLYPFNKIGKVGGLL